MTPAARRLSTALPFLLACSSVLFIHVALVQYADIVYVDGNELTSDSVSFTGSLPLVLFARLIPLVLLCAGLFFAYRARNRRELRIPLIVLAAALAWSAVLLLLKTTSPGEVLSSFTLFSNYAPGTLCILGLFFAGAQADSWEAMRDGLSYLVLAVAVTGVAMVPFIHIGSRASAREYLGAVVSFLQICAVMPIFTPPKRVPRWLGYLPLLVTVIGGVLTETRLVFVLLGVQLIAVALLKRRQVLRFLVQPRVDAVHLLAGVLLTLFTLAAVTLALAGPFHAASQGFGSRLNEDTRTHQAENFFTSVPTETFLLGKGYPTGNEPTSQGVSGIDLGYVNTLYVGGVPALCVLVFFFVVPGLLLIVGKHEERLALQVGPVCLATTLAFSSSFVMEPTPALLFAVMCSGRAYALLFDQAAETHKGRQFFSRSNPWRGLQTGPHAR